MTCVWATRHSGQPQCTATPHITQNTDSAPKPTETETLRCAERRRHIALQLEDTTCESLRSYCLHCDIS